MSGLPPYMLETTASVQTSELSNLRSAVIDALPRTSTIETRDDVGLLVTELATNAIRHSGAGPDARLHVRMYDRDHRLCVEVEDPGAGFDPAAPQPRADGGWGLQIVDRMAADWGIRPGPRPPTVVWFELPLPP